MQYSDTSEYQGLLQDINFLAGLSPTDTTRYTTKDKTRNINKAYRSVLAWIWKSQGGWTFDDSNLTDIPYFKTNCTTSQDDYTLPVGYGIVERIEYKDASGIWTRLKKITRDEIKTGLEEWQKTDGTPRYVELFANSYRIFPAANRTSTDGDSIRVYCTRDIDEFTSSDTTQMPGFNKNFHHILGYMAAKDWAIREKDQKRINPLDLEIAKIRADIESYYGNRDNLEQERIIPRRRQFNAR